MDSPAAFRGGIALSMTPDASIRTAVQSLMPPTQSTPAELRQLSSFGYFGGQQASPRDRPVLRHLLLQAPATAEGRAAAQAVRAAGLPVSIAEAKASEVQRFAQHLEAGCCLPVGSAAFLHGAKLLAGVQDAAWPRHPRPLAPFTLQQPRLVPVRVALRMPRPLLISPPHATPTFDPFLLIEREKELQPDAREQFARLLDLPASTLVYAALTPMITAKWRYYVVYGEVVGFARYDRPCETDLLQPDIADVSAMIAAMPTDAAFVLDVALLEEGGCILEGLRDPLEARLVPAGLDRPNDVDFLRMLWARWRELIRTSRGVSIPMTAT